ncbi:aminoacyl-tRNA hydrolase [Thiomicrospira sp. WB1]|uniref:aminoacyl-tRNA hydrolase n=1 Tax=Thiomicrospira sp. WB1 TaxID=1685380 RepID=UPI00074B1B4E|nr:aminoacyl-tRNA hydrolase [Thiomicrospira sp. WB1]KUJ72612.1 peptidyl-tRNA hydrolase [Thiomicrospira sp. WB1]
MARIKLIVGLGNPGAQYDQTRHNAGFWFVDAVAQTYQVQWRPETKFLGQVARIQQPNMDVWLLKPTTYMNRSGQAIQAIAHFYKIDPEEILVVHDELDLEPGVARLKTGGGHGGHNGLRDTIAALSTKDFQRLRLGIGHPGHRDQVVQYVLKAASKTDQQAIMTAIDEAVRVLEPLVKGERDAAMQQLHTQT